MVGGRPDPPRPPEGTVCRGAPGCQPHGQGLREPAGSARVGAGGGEVRKGQPLHIRTRIIPSGRQCAHTVILGEGLWAPSCGHLSHVAPLLGTIPCIRAQPPGLSAPPPP